MSRINKIQKIKAARMLGFTLKRLGILGDINGTSTSPCGNPLAKQWGLAVCKDYVFRLEQRCALPEQLNSQRTILIDDVRKYEADVVCRDYFSGVDALQHYGPFGKLYLDHDLASYDKHGKEWTGYDLVCWLEQNPKYAPRHIECISSNPVGRRNIEQAVQQIYKQRRNCV